MAIRGIYKCRDILPVCSNKARAATHSNGTHGNQWWKRDVYHAHSDEMGDRTVCGFRDGEWLKMDVKPLLDALKDDSFCDRCSKLLTP